MNTNTLCETAVFPQEHTAAIPSCPQVFPTEPSPPAASNKEETSYHDVSNSASEAEAGKNDFTANGHVQCARSPQSPQRAGVGARGGQAPGLGR